MTTGTESNIPTNQTKSWSFDKVTRERKDPRIIKLNMKKKFILDSSKVHRIIREHPENWLYNN